ncbi:hypothetical protein BH10PLA1_BH10PLA1_13240 [soil metagenome]
MANRNQPTLVGVFPSRNEAEIAIDELKQAGFDKADVGFAIRGEEPGGMITDSALTKDAEGAKEGMITGGLAGGIIGAMAAMVIPGAGPVLAAGVLTSALGFGAAGMATGGILGAMMGLGVSEEEAKVYEQEFKAGRAIVTVHAGGRELEAASILRRHGAYNVHSEAVDPRPTINPL